MVDFTPESIEGLVAILARADQEPIERCLQAISQLGDIQDPRAIFSLLEFLQSSSKLQLMIHCMSVLSRIKAYSAVMVMVDVAMGCGVDLYEKNPQLAEFKQTDECIRLRCAAIQALGRMGDERAIVPLMSLLNEKSENYRLRLAAAESLGKLGDTNAISPLIHILSDEREKSIYLKESAAKALGMLGDIRAIEPLIDVLESKRGFLDKFNFLKEQIIEAIGRIGSPHRKATENLLQALQDGAPSIRLAAVEALGEIGDDTCIHPIKALLHDKNEDVAFAAISALYKLGGESMMLALLAEDNIPLLIRDELESYIP